MLPGVTRVLVGAGWQSLTKEEGPHPDLEGLSPATEEKTVQKQGERPAHLLGRRQEQLLTSILCLEICTPRTAGEGAISLLSNCSFFFFKYPLTK